MPTNVTWDGVSYSIPNAGELNWASLTSFLVALGNKAAVAEEMKQAIRVATTTPVSVVSGTDFAVVVDLSSAGPSVVNLPAGISGQVFAIVDGKGDASTNNITINPNGAETIGGGASIVLNKNRQAVLLQYHVATTDWKLLQYPIPVGGVTPSDITGVVPANKGGTGVANNAAATLTRSGNHDLAITTSAPTTVTMPVTGTLATLAGSETLSNKTLVSPKLDDAGAGDLVVTSASGLTADRTLTIDVNDASRSLDMGGNIVTGGNLTTTPANAVTLTTTGATNVTLPTTGTLASLAGSETLSNKTLVSPLVDTSLTLLDQGQLILREDSGSGTNSVAIQSPATLAADYTLTLPIDDGASGQVLATDGSGVLTWSNAGEQQANIRPAEGAGTTTLTSADAKYQVFNLSANRNVDLPSTGVTAGMIYTMREYADGSVLQVRSSAGNNIIALRGATASVVALVNTPTIAGDWNVVTPGPVYGTQTNNNAIAGYVGEFISSSYTNATAGGVNGVWIDGSNVSLTAGDWEVTHQASWERNTAVLSGIYWRAGISINSGNSFTDEVRGTNSQYYRDGGTGLFFDALTITTRISISSTTTYYAKLWFSDVSVGEPFVSGILRARRVR